MCPIRTTAVVLAFLAAACSPRTGAPQPTDALLSSIQASTAGDSVHFLLQLTNTSDLPVALEFTSGRTFEILVHQEDVVLWNSTAGRSFTQALVFDTIAAGGTRSFQASWAPPPTARGEMSVTGVVRDSRQPIQQSTRFRYP